MLPEFSPLASMMVAFSPDDPPPTIVTEWLVVVMSRSPVAAAFSCVAFASVRLYVVAGCRLIVMGIPLTSAFEAMMTPRKLQSFGATVHAVAAAVSSVRSTSNVVANNGVRLEVPENAGSVCRSRELDDTFSVYLEDAQTNATIANKDDQNTLFMVITPRLM